jgi:organic radical activating enzyme
MSDEVLPVAEVFGPTWQGEGPHAGVRTGFVRLGLCNLSCEWCDTPYTWDSSRYDLAAEAPDMTVAEVFAQLRPMDVDTVCLSGGEPLMHHQRLRPLLHPDWEWHAETNGTIPPPPWWAEHVAHTSVSPKINTRDPEKKRLKPHALRGWAALARRGMACFKFVAATPADLEAVAAITAEYGVERRDVWVMPQGTTTDELLERHQWLAPRIERYGWNTTTRLHVLLYGTERRR